MPVIVRRAWNRAFLPLLTTVEEAGSEEDHGDEEGQLGVLHGVVVEADEAVHEPGGESGEPYPCEVTHGRYDAPRRRGAAMAREGHLLWRNRANPHLAMRPPDMGTRQSHLSRFAAKMGHPHLCEVCPPRCERKQIVIFTQMKEGVAGRPRPLFVMVRLELVGFFDEVDG